MLWKNNWQLFGLAIGNIGCRMFARLACTVSATFYQTPQKEAPETGSLDGATADGDRMPNRRVVRSMNHCFEKSRRIFLTVVRSRSGRLMEYGNKVGVPQAMRGLVAESSRRKPKISSQYASAYPYFTKRLQSGQTSALKPPSPVLQRIDSDPAETRNPN